MTPQFRFSDFETAPTQSGVIMVEIRFGVKQVFGVDGGRVPKMAVNQQT